MNRAALAPLTRDGLIALILEQAAQISALTARIAEMEAKLAIPPKTPNNSSLPPSKGQKPNLPERAKKKSRSGRPGVARALAEHPDKIIEATLAACPHCDHALGLADMSGIHAYDHIDLPPIRPIVTRINRHRGVCPFCRKQVSAPAPEGFEPGSPFGPGIEALIIHLHITQAVSFERLARLMGEVFALSISEGAIANILARAQTPLLAAADTIAEAVRASPVVGSDETSARVRGKTWWQWVLLSSTAICHLIADTRAASVVTTFLQGARPEVWVADRYGGQLGHGAVRQMCLAHLLRDATYAIEAGDAVFAPGFKRLLLRAVAIGKRRPALKGSTLAQYSADLDRRLDKLLSGPEPKQESARRLFRAMRRDRADLFRFVTRRDVPYTNNACERALRPSVIFRKVTNCFRAEWGAKVYAAAASVIATGRLHGRTALEALRDALAGTPVIQSG
ncbi:MAG: IS66 family transposase [Rhodanobacteraceae bacterium]